MAATLPVTDKVDSLTDITKNMTKYIRHLEANVHSIKKLPTHEDILNEVKNNVWYRMCKPCQSKIFDLSSKDLYSRKEYPSKRLCNGAKVTDIGNSKTSHKLKNSDREESFDAPIEIEQMLAKIECMPHQLQLQDQGKIEDLQTQVSTLKNSIEEKTQNITSLENQLKMYLKSHTENTEGKERYKNEEKQIDFDKVQRENEEYIRDISQLQTERQTLEDQTTSLNKTREKQGDFDTVQKEKEEYVEQLSQLQTERQTLEDQTSSLTSTNEELSSTVEGLQRDIDRLTVELEEKQGDFDKGQKEKVEYVRDISQLQTERQTLEDRISSLNRTNEELSSALKVQQQNVEKMTGELEEKQSELNKVQKENERYITDISQLQTEKQTFQDQASSLNWTNQELTSAMEGLQRDIDRLTGELERNQGDFDRVQKEKEEYVKQVSQLQTERQTLDDQTSSLTRTSEELSSTVEGLQRNIDRLTVELEEKQSNFDKGQKGEEEYVGEASQLQTEKQTLQDQKSSPNWTNEEVTSAMNDLQWDIDRLTGELAGMTLHDQTRPLNKANEELSSTLKIKQQNIEKMTGELVLEECRRLKKKSVVMRLLRTSRSGLGKTMVDMVTKELKRQLGERLDSRNFDFSIVLSETQTYVFNGPLFVLCLNMSRNGTNIQDALEGTKGGKDVYVLVLHHTNKDNLSTLTPTNLRVTGSELQQLGGIIDLAFSSNSGLYECDLNITAADKIATVLKKF